MAQNISIIVTMAQNGVIGSNGKIPWDIPEDRQFFKETTWGHPVIMGRKTYQSIGKPLKGRLNVVVSKDTPLSKFPSDIEVARSLDEAFHIVESHVGYNDEVMVIGGSQIYRLAMPMASKIYLTVVKSDFIGDAYFPFIRSWRETSKQNYQSSSGDMLAYDLIIYEK